MAFTHVFICSIRVYPVYVGVNLPLLAAHDKNLRVAAMHRPPKRLKHWYWRLMQHFLQQISSSCHLCVWLIWAHAQAIQA